MKTAGIVGGIGPESTIEYYRQLLACHRRRAGEAVAPSLLIDSIDVDRLLSLVGSGRLPDLTDYLVAEVERLSRAGAAFAAIAANTPHIVFDDVRTRASIPLVSIVEATCRAASARGLRRLGLFGTRFTMEASFYPEVFERAGLAVVAPAASDRTRIHAWYTGELLRGIVRDETRSGLVEIAGRMAERERIDAVILGGTELSLILREDAVPGIPLLDTTRIHVEEIVTEMLA